MSALPVAPPRTAAQFIDTIGVDSHVSTGAAGYGNLSNVLADLKYLGVSNVRDGDNGSLNSLITMAQAGIKFDFLLAGGGSMVTADIQGEFSIIDQVSRAVAGSVAAVEGANEINNFPVTFNGVGGLQGAVAMQQAIYSLAHADAALPGVAVYYFTGYDAGNVAVGPNPATTAGLADYDNQHPYPQGGQPPAGWVARTQALPNETPANGPAVYTETGYSNTGTFGGNLGLVGQAKYTLDLLMDDAQTGVAHTYLYELMEEGDGFGLFAANNNPNPVATAIHNLTTILADTGTVSSTATAANYTISGMPSSGHSMALLRSTGATDIVVWAEPQISASVSGPAVNVVVSLGATYGTVKVFDPLQGTAATQTLTNVGSVTLSLTDHPLIVEVSNDSVAPPPPPPPPPPPSPNDTVVLAGSSAAINDASGNRWTITAGGQVAVNGAADPLTSQVTELAYVNGAVWQENTAKLWYEKTSPAASWTPNGGHHDKPAASAAAAGYADASRVGGRVSGRCAVRGAHGRQAGWRHVHRLGAAWRRRQQRLHADRQLGAGAA